MLFEVIINVVVKIYAIYHSFVIMKLTLKYPVDYISMRLANIILLSLLSLSSFSQKDTLFLFNDCCIIGEKKINQTIDGEKEGLWIKYDLKKYDVIPMNVVLWSGMDSLGNSVDGEFHFEYKYEATGIYDSDNYHKIHTHSYFTSERKIIVLNYLPPEKYYISSKGTYKNGLKDGKWISYYQNEQIKKRIKFKNGRLVNGFKVFRENGTIMFSVSVLGDDKFEVCRFIESKNTQDCSIYSFEEIRFLID